MSPGVGGRHGGTAPTENQGFWDYWTGALGADVLADIAVFVDERKKT